MKTTVDISDALLEEARRWLPGIAPRARALIERGLRSVLAERNSASQFRLRKATFQGEGLQPGSGGRLLGADARDGLSGPWGMIALDTNLLV